MWYYKIFVLVNVYRIFYSIIGICNEYYKRKSWDVKKWEIYYEKFVYFFFIVMFLNLKIYNFIN